MKKQRAANTYTSWLLEQPNTAATGALCWDSYVRSDRRTACISPGSKHSKSSYMATKPGFVYGKINGSWYSDVRNESVFKAKPHASLTYSTF